MKREGSHRHPTSTATTLHWTVLVGGAYWFWGSILPPIEGQIPLLRVVQLMQSCALCEAEGKYSQQTMYSVNVAIYSVNCELPPDRRRVLKICSFFRVT